MHLHLLPGLRPHGGNSGAAPKFGIATGWVLRVFVCESDIGILILEVFDAFEEEILNLAPADDLGKVGGGDDPFKEDPQPLLG